MVTAVMAPLTFKFKGEIFREMPTFMVSSKQEETVFMTGLQCPQIQHTLWQKIKDMCERMIQNTHTSQ